jgi:hypothetical protein
MLQLFSRILFAVIFTCFMGFGAIEAPCRFSVAAEFTEETIALSWSNCPGAAGYNVYADYGHGFSKANFSPVTSRNRFTLLWLEVNGVKERVVKGNSVECRIVPLVLRITKKDTTYVEGPTGCNVKNDFFRGFSNILSDSGCVGIIEDRQITPKIFPAAVSVSRAVFCSLYTRMASNIHTVYKTKIDPKDQGACVPFSTMVSHYFTYKGIRCYRAQGTFIGRFHSFNLVVIDSTEYILDFTADQFLPNSSPVFIPRDYCFVDSSGSPTRRPGGIFTRIYNIDKVFSADQIAFTGTSMAKEYQRILDALKEQ